MELRLDRWERRVQLPLTISSLLFIAAYAWPILNPGIASSREVAGGSTWLGRYS